LRALLFILTIVIIFSGCIEESKVTQSNESVHGGSVNTTPESLSATALSSKEKNIPEIEITSFSSIYMHDNNEKVFDYHYLFNWNNVPGSETKELINYLRNDLEIDWVSTATIIKAADNNTIHVFTPTKSLELKLSDDKNTVLIAPNHILKVKREDNRLCVYGDEEVRSKTGYNITERYYAIYGLSIKNNGSKDLDFKLNELNLRDGNHIFSTTSEPESQSSLIEVLSDLEKETKLEDTTLSPGQIINGFVVFQVNSLYNKSFLLVYNDTTITSASFEKSIEALNTAERYNYSEIFGKPPYNDGFNDSFEYSGFSNWVNRSIFKVVNRADIELFNKDISLYTKEPSNNYIYGTKLVYALKVISERNITAYTHFVNKNGFVVADSTDSTFKVVDDTGEELVNTSRIDKIAILKNQTYDLHSGDSTDFTKIIDNSQINFSNATIVRISFFRESGLASFVNQNIIVDKELNIAAASNNCLQFYIN